MKRQKAEGRRHQAPGTRRWRHSTPWIAALALALLLAWPLTVEAYIGPGAGFALLTSFFTLGLTFVLAVGALLSWPFRVIWRRLRRPRRGRALARRLIIVGFDGQEPTLTDRWMAAGLLPQFARLAEHGCYHRLRTTFPPVSPVAWSSFSTGTNPGRHNVFDFLDRDRRTYLPLLSSARITASDRTLTIGRFRIPLRKPELRLLRRSRPFWSVLGQAGIWSTILRVPISFPPERFFGAQLSAMAAPDLLGTQGTFLLYTTRLDRDVRDDSGIRMPLIFAGEVAETRIDGPANPFAADGALLSVRMRVTRHRPHGGAEAPTGGVKAPPLRIDLPGQRLTLTPGVLSDWIPLAFRAAPLVNVRGYCRMQVTELADHVSIYLTPISLDPEHPAMPISHPPYYAAYLAKKIGPYSTLGLAEDTWALNEGVIDQQTFLRQTWDIDNERQRMFFAALDRLREGTLACVFDATDRVQHMCWDDLERSETQESRQERQRSNAIEEQYRRNDQFLGRVMAQLKKDDVLMVLSDHGFGPFKRGVNLNRWLLDHGYLSLRDGTDGTGDWLHDVDWSRTRAYAFGLTGLFLNLEGREASGIVRRGEEAARIKAELVAALSGLVDDETREVGIREVFDTSRVYNGPYTGNAPDLLVGYNRGYRASWACASGHVAGPVFADNTKPWSGDHCIDPRLVPGVFFCSRAIERDDPALIDIAPTALRLFGLDVPRHIEGQALFDVPA